jgi:hypothetical protein
LNLAGCITVEGDGWWGEPGGGNKEAVGHCF